ncbi:MULTISPECIES: helix-turn-helix domain-containing protein [unclassified Imperialibacter]|uniref:helix-turn-helix domain-containing protein n=1 Tax=unclassified Imperialibacter TaxID=2629706 RepID=UPI00125C0733|nr:MULTISPECIES: helix-turn-helix domain-containing protein [unclassified Imperialibacter]CAD5249385.1 Transcriptional regulator, AraC family [Imperialibacter sp. 89]CAD5264456.1 Transcriptional regulator, AraC family [Imperialibacter sp. 75]VVT06861.1 Transcriptional regulator, AraC family [Imperialibacter sp. EC-SDR9]
MSADGENEYFCDGITEEIINALARVTELKVTSRTSSFYFKHHKASIREIGEKLNVSAILEGSVRVGGNMLRITAQLIEVATDSHFWSQTWDRKLENIFEIQDEVSLHIADKLREQFGHMEIGDHLAKSPTQNLNAYELLLKGKYLFNRWNPEDVNKAISLFEQAIEQDPDLVDAHMGLSDAYGFLATAGFAPREASWKKAFEHMKIVERINPNHAPLNYQLANHAFFTEADYNKAFKYTLKSIKSRPTYPEGQQFMAFLYLLKNDTTKANEHLQYVRSVDPLNQETLFYQAYYFYRTEEFEKAAAICQQLLEVNPKNLPAYIVHCYCLFHLGRIDQVIEETANMPDEIMIPDERAGINALAYLMKGDSNNAAPYINEVMARSNENASFQADAYAFWIYAQQCKADEAFAIVEKLFTHQSSILLLNYYDPLAKNLRGDDRFWRYADLIYPELKHKESTPKTNTSQLDEATAAAYEEKLMAVVNDELPYLNPSLSLRSLAEQIEMHPNQLSWLLNEKIGRNFNEFINDFRIGHFKKLAVDPANSHISLVGLAFESGFNSKTVFNTYFKKAEGMTPSAFLKHHS